MVPVRSGSQRSFHVPRATVPSAPYYMIEVLALNAALRLRDANYGIGESAA